MTSGRSLRASVAVAALTAAVVGTVAVPAAAYTASVTRSHARTVAKAINLRSSDFPGYTETAYKKSKSGDALAKSFAKCTGAAKHLVDVTSPMFANSSGYGFSSNTVFVASRAAAKRDAQRAQSAHTRKCFHQELTKATKSAGVPGVKVTLTPLHESAVAGIDAIYGYKITVSFSLFGHTGHAHGYLINVVRGNAEVGLNEFGTADVSQSVTAKPLATLIGRAKQQVPATGLSISH